MIFMTMKSVDSIMKLIEREIVYFSDNIQKNISNDEISMI